MSINPNEDTEFNDALRKHGILPPREPTPPSPSPPSSPKLENILYNASQSELKDLEDDEIDSDTERMIASYRRQRLTELRKSQKTAKFGEVYPIGREDYTREVTDASKMELPGEPQIKGTGVVCFLYKDGQVSSTRLAGHLNTLAARHPLTKFVSIVGDKCIPNYSDKLCPTLIIYRGGEVTQQVVAWGGDRERTFAELEAMLILSLAITTAPPPSDSGKPSTSDDEASEDDERGTSSTILRSATEAGLTRPKPRKNLRANAQDDEDFDFDL